MNRILEIFLVAVYNLTLLAGACYLVYYKDASAWLFLLALCFGASWKEEGGITSIIKVAKGKE